MTACKNLPLISEAIVAAGSAYAETEPVAA